MKNRNLVLLETLRSRLAEVEHLISENYSAKDEKSNVGEKNAEEYLRQFMVSVFPRVKKEGQQYKKLNLFFNLLNHLYAFTFSDDFRFLDAYNNAFETILFWKEVDDTETQVFFNKYKTMLLHHINVLTQ